MSPEKPTFVRYQVLAVACSLAVLTYVQRQGFIAATPYIKEDFGLDSSQLNFLYAAWLVAYGIFQVPGGLFGDRIGARYLITVLVLGWSLTLVAVALTFFLPAAGWGALVVLLVLRFVFGAFQAGVFPGLSRVVADWMPAQQRGFAQGSIWTCSRVGGAFAPVLVVWLITKVFHGWSTTIALVAGLGFVWCAFFWLWFRNRPEEMPQLNQAERDIIAQKQPVAAVTIGPAPWDRMLASPSVWGLCLMYGFVGFAGNFITSSLNDYLQFHRNLSGGTTAWLAGLPLAAGVVSSLSGGVISDWLIRLLGNRNWGRRFVGGVALALAGVATFCTPWVHEVWQLAIIIGAWMFFNDAMLGPAWASCADVGERYAGTISGAMNMTGAFMGAAGVTMAGYCLKHGHYHLLFTLFAGSYALASLCWLLIDVTRPIVPRQGDD